MAAGRSFKPSGAAFKAPGETFKAAANTFKLAAKTFKLPGRTFKVTSENFKPTDVPFNASGETLFPEIPRLKYRAFDHDRATRKEKKLLIKREGHSLRLRWQSQTEGPPPLDALFAFGSMAPQSLLGEQPFWLNDVFIGIWGHRCTSIAGLGLP
jgi:hypothetical protein